MESLAQVLKWTPKGEKESVVREAYRDHVAEVGDMYTFLIMYGYSAYRTAKELRDLSMAYIQTLVDTEYDIDKIGMTRPPPGHSLLEDVKSLDAYYKDVLVTYLPIYQHFNPEGFSKMFEQFSKIGKVMIPGELLGEARRWLHDYELQWMEGVAFIIEDMIYLDKEVEWMKVCEIPLTLEEHLANLGALDAESLYWDVVEKSKSKGDKGIVEAMLAEQIIMNNHGPWGAALAVKGRLHSEHSIERSLSWLREKAYKMTEVLYLTVSKYDMKDSLGDLVQYGFITVPVEMLRRTRKAAKDKKIPFKERALFFKPRPLSQAWRKREKQEEGKRRAGSLIL